MNQVRPVQAFEKCPKHVGNDIILFCLAAQCMEPLCKECCKIHCHWHNQLGTKVEIDTVENVREHCIQDVHELKMRFEEERAILHHFSDGEHSELLNSIHSKLEQAKQKLQNMINEYMASLEQQIKQRILQHRAAHPGEKKDLHQKLNVIIANLDGQEKGLISQNYMRALLQVLTEEKNHDLDGMANDIDRTIQHYLANMFDVFVHDNKLGQIKQDLQAYVEIHEANLKEELQIITQQVRQGKKVYGMDKFGNPMVGAENRNVMSQRPPSQSGNNFGTSAYYNPNLQESNNEKLKSRYYDL